MSNFLKKFNFPAKFFNALGYITVVVGLIVTIVGIFNTIVGFGAYNSVGAPDSVAFSSWISGWVYVALGLIIAIVCPQLFFAIAKIVRAAEKYLGN